MDDSVAWLLRENSGVVVRRDHPELAAIFDWLLRTDRLVRVLPGSTRRPRWPPCRRSAGLVLARRSRRSGRGRSPAPP
ncbi:hypothetical protein [uncultured Friedmanniella sp.]|uniref:hypothetical protein n=1 Tax=uncultured Friedmanniella sp. TaxID=335381 RepID=UPI0035C94746